MQKIDLKQGDYVFMYVYFVSLKIFLQFFPFDHFRACARARVHTHTHTSFHKYVHEYHEGSEYLKREKSSFIIFYRYLYKSLSHTILSTYVFPAFAVHVFCTSRYIGCFNKSQNVSNIFSKKLK